MKTKMKITSLYVEEYLMDRVKEIADKTPSMTVNLLIRKFIKDGLKRLKNKDPEDI